MVIVSVGAIGVMILTTLAIQVEINNENIISTGGTTPAWIPQAAPDYYGLYSIFVIQLFLAIANLSTVCCCVNTTQPRVELDRRHQRVMMCAGVLAVVQIILASVSLYSYGRFNSLPMADASSEAKVLLTGFVSFAATFGSR